MPEPTDTQAESLFFAWIAMVPFVIGAIAAWPYPPAFRLTVIWGGTILAFLSGVRRGLSFRTPDGPHIAQLATMMLLFLLALAALLAPAQRWSAIPLIVGFGTIALLVRPAARRAEIPPFFVNLRPMQMLVPVASLTVLLCHH
jgi:hypothetical protein